MIFSSVLWCSGVLSSLYLYPGVLAVHGDAEVVGGGEGVQPGQGEGGETGEGDCSEN